MPPRPAWKDSSANKGNVWQISRTGQVNIDQKVHIRSELDFRKLSGHTYKIFDCWNHLSCNLVQVVGQRYGGKPSRGPTQNVGFIKKEALGRDAIHFSWILVLTLPGNTHLKLYNNIQFVTDSVLWEGCWWYVKMLLALVAGGGRGARIILCTADCHQELCHSQHQRRHYLLSITSLFFHLLDS